MLNMLLGEWVWLYVRGYDRMFAQMWCDVFGPKKSCVFKTDVLGLNLIRFQIWYCDALGPKMYTEGSTCVPYTERNEMLAKIVILTF